jgi:hypothetical protein
MYQAPASIPVQPGSRTTTNHFGAHGTNRPVFIPMVVVRPDQSSLSFHLSIGFDFYRSEPSPFFAKELSMDSGTHWREYVFKQLRIK